MWDGLFDTDWAINGNVPFLSNQWKCLFSGYDKFLKNVWKIKFAESTYVNTAAHKDKELKFSNSLLQIRSFSRMWARTVVWAQSLTLRLVSSVWHGLAAAVSINTQVFITGLQSQLLDLVVLLTSLWPLALTQAELFPFQSMTISWFNLV